MATCRIHLTAFHLTMRWLCSTPEMLMVFSREWGERSLRLIRSTVSYCKRRGSGGGRKSFWRRLFHIYSFVSDVQSRTVFENFLSFSQENYVIRVFFGFSWKTLTNLELSLVCVTLDVLSLTRYIFFLKFNPILSHVLLLCMHIHNFFFLKNWDRGWQKKLKELEPIIDEGYGKLVEEKDAIEFPVFYQVVCKIVEYLTIFV